MSSPPFDPREPSYRNGTIRSCCLDALLTKRRPATLRATASLKTHAFYREAQGCHVSSLGLGTYLGAMSPRGRRGYTAAVLAAVRGGINFIDTSLNYRNQRSERAIGQAIIKLTQHAQGGRSR